MTVRFYILPIQHIVDERGDMRMSIVVKFDLIYLFRDDEEKSGQGCRDDCENCPTREGIKNNGSCSVIDIASGKSVSVYQEIKQGRGYVYAGWRSAGGHKKVYLGKAEEISCGKLYEKLIGAFNPC